MNCPVCQTPLGRGSFCPRCGWDTSADPELHPTLFSAAGVSARRKHSAQLLAADRDERETLVYTELGRLLFAGYPLDILQACLEAEDPSAAARELLVRESGKEEPEEAVPLRVNTLAAGAFDQALCRKARSICFRDTLSGLPKDAWDLSQERNGSVMAYLGRGFDRLTLTVCGEGGVWAPEDCRALFWDLDNLRSVDFGGCFHTENCRSMNGMFRECSSLETLDLRGFDTGRVTDMGSMFYGCTALTTLDLRSFDTARVEDMSFMFYGCSSLWKLNLGSGFRTGQVATMRSMFNSCSALEKLDLSGFDTGRVNDMSYLFSSCSSLQELDVSSFDTARVTDMFSMFRGCAGLQALDVSGFNTALVADMRYLFKDCVSLSKLDTGGFMISPGCSTEEMFSGVPGREDNPQG